MDLSTPTYDGGLVALYEDSVEMATGEGEIGAPLDTELTLGAFPSAASEIGWRIDKFGIWVPALAAGEVAALAEHSSFDGVDAPVIWWGFDEGVGDIIDDGSGNGHEATLVGGTWVHSCAP